MGGSGIFGGAPRQEAESPRVGLSVCLYVCVSVCNKKYFRSSALTPFRDLRFKNVASETLFSNTDAVASS